MKGFKAGKEGEHVVVFTFKDNTKMMKVPAAESWSFDKHLVVLQRYHGCERNEFQSIYLLGSSA